MTEPEFLHRTRVSYDTLAEDYADWIRTELAARPLERAVLAAFAELVREAGAGPVADIGCGPGRLTAHLDGLGVPAFGIDLSPRMIAVARGLYPALRFDEGSMIELDIEDGTLGGVLAWYSIIHVPLERLPEVFAEFHRVLAPGGHLQLAFQAGDELSHRSEAAGHQVSLDFHRRQPDQIAELLRRAGLVPRARMLREPDQDWDFPETTSQAFLLARKPQS
ncbi:class I SAM-dependent DNA methyltransferase [Amycolatopsis aidingensis]|uniref:class I SAM-dependent DNA methyltransferase n=1 Tax=Amycolatopsis aidingensis TaxID=2842453 RepID=UPI001C0CC8B2|nr:class I SAM-dependent methyltransferase [Amycolatopsis aidingensis]